MRGLFCAPLHHYFTCVPMSMNNLSKYSDAGLLLFRLGFGLAFLFFHGWGKLMGGPDTWAGVGGALDHIGIGFGHAFFGFLAAFAESIGGLMIAVGLFYRPFCLLLALTMLVASLNHILGEGSPAHALKNLFVLVGLMPMGPGRYSVDHYLALPTADTG